MADKAGSLDDSRRGQLLYFRFRKAKPLLQDRNSVFAEQGRWSMNNGWRAAEFWNRANQRDCACDGMLNLLYHVARLRLWVSQCSRYVVDRATGNAR